jgi:hypothetical protein
VLVVMDATQCWTNTFFLAFLSASAFNALFAFFWLFLLGPSSSSPVVAPSSSSSSSSSPSPYISYQIHEAISIGRPKLTCVDGCQDKMLINTENEINELAGVSRFVDVIIAVIRR